MLLVNLISVWKTAALWNRGNEHLSLEIRRTFVGVAPAAAAAAAGGAACRQRDASQQAADERQPDVGGVEADTQQDGLDAREVDDGARRQQQRRAGGE